MLIFRPARADELQRAQELVVLSINDLTERHGFGRMATVRLPEFQLFCLQDDPDGLWVAEADGEIVGFALSWVCGDLWFLAELFVAPGHQGRGVGNGLLARTLEHARKAGATNRSLITFTFNVVSQGLYIRHGLFPRLPIYLFSVARDALMPRLKGETLRSTPIEPTAAHLDRVVSYMTCIGALYLGAVFLIPELLVSFAQTPFYLGGASVLVVVCTVLDIETQVRGRSLTKPGGVFS